VKNIKYFRVVALLAGLLAFNGLAYATTCDLTDTIVGNYCGNSALPAGTDINGAIFQVGDFQSTGTGFIQPFVRIQDNDSELGYNTSGGTPLDTKAGIWTHDLKFSDLTIVTLPDNGLNYYAFTVDINEDKGSDHEFISLDEIQLFSTTVGSQTVTTFTGGGLLNLAGVTSLIYRLDAGDATNVVDMDYTINPGSGAGDMTMYIPVGFFSGVGVNDYIVLYSHFGGTTANPGFATSDGFEEWWAVQGHATPVVPEPATLILLGTGLLGIAGKVRRRMKKS
jgi:hypothetical protein